MTTRRATTTAGGRRVRAQRSYRAKVFRNGGSQAIRLPKECQVPGKEVSIRRVGSSLVVSPVAETWDDEFRALFLEGPPRDAFPSLKALRRGLGRARDVVL